MNMLGLCQLYISHLQHVTENFSFYKIHKSSLSPGFAKQIMPILFIMDNSVGQHSHSSRISSRSMTNILSKYARVSKWGFPFRRRNRWPLYVVSARVYTRCHGVQVTMVSVNPLSRHCTKWHLYKVHSGFLSMKACAAGYGLSYATTLKLQLVSSPVVSWFCLVLC
jgi:hypothetical protein